LRCNCADRTCCIVVLLLLLLLQVWLPELGFRLRRLHMMYPEFVTK
jgi:hypothetical protein